MLELLSLFKIWCLYVNIVIVGAASDRKHPAEALSVMH